MAVIIKNEYLDEYERLIAAAIPNSFDVGYTSRLRDKMVQRYAWAIPNDKAIKAIAKHGPIIELGAGSGYWASLIKQYGADVVCFDDKSFTRHGEWLYERSSHHLVQKGSYEKLSRFPEHTLMLCWPNYDDPFAVDSLRAYKGDVFIYIGEPEYGCTGCNEFHEELYANWVEIESIDIPQWYGIDDKLFIYKRLERDDD